MMFLYVVKTLVAVKKRRVIQRPNYNESDENFSTVMCLLLQSYHRHLLYVTKHSDYFLSIAV